MLRRGPHAPAGRGRPDEAGARRELRAVAIGVVIVAQHIARGAIGLAAMTILFAPEIHAAAERRPQVRHQRPFVQCEKPADILRAAGDALAGEIAGTEGIIFPGLAAHAAIIHAGAGPRVVGGCPYAGPRGAERVGRNIVLVARGRFRGAGGVDRTERAGEGLILAVGDGIPRELFARAGVEGDGAEVFVRGVLLVGRAVVAVLAIGARGDGQLQVRCDLLPPATREPAVFARGGEVDRAAVLGRDQRKTVGGEIATEQLEGDAARRPVFV